MLIFIFVLLCAGAVPPDWGGAGAGRLRQRADLCQHLHRGRVRRQDHRQGARPQQEPGLQGDRYVPPLSGQLANEASCTSILWKDKRQQKLC